MYFATTRAINTSSTIAWTFVIIISCAIGLCVIVAILRHISNKHIEKNRKKYFDLNKPSCADRQKEGKDLLESYKTYDSYIKELHLIKTIRCSNSVVSASMGDEVKYVLKYTNVNQSVDDIEKLEYISEYLVKSISFLTKMEKTGKMVKKSIPWFYRLFIKKEKIVWVVCDLPYEMKNMKIPYVRFSYISSAGRSRHDNKIVIGPRMIGGLVEEISRTMNKKGHAKSQRSAMTNDLREAIKKRDNYTCCKCGNSVYNEPNLLLEVDHIIPVSRGGKTEAPNLQTLCWRCNRAKGDKE